MKKPIFLSQMGALNDFYIWGRDQKTIELGMLYTENGKKKKKFDICELDLKDYKIHDFYHHKIKCNNSNSDLCSEYLIIVA